MKNRTPSTAIPSQASASLSARDGESRLPSFDNRRLMRAVLAEALLTYRTGLSARSARQRVEACSIEAWVSSQDTDWPFAFENVCDSLGIDPNAIRDRMRRLRRLTLADTTAPGHPVRVRRGPRGA